MREGPESSHLGSLWALGSTHQPTHSPSPQTGSMATPDSPAAWVAMLQVSWWEQRWTLGEAAMALQPGVLRREEHTSWTFTDGPLPGQTTTYVPARRGGVQDDAGWYHLV